MKNISKCEVNKKYILVLKEENENLSVEEFPIENTKELRHEIKECVEDEHTVLWDLYSRFVKKMGKKKEYNYCYPYEYDKAFIDKAVLPEKVEYYSLEAKIETRKKEIQSSFDYKWLDEPERSEFLKKKMKKYKQYLIEDEYENKKEYAKRIIRYIRCEKLHEAISYVRDCEQIKMYSTDYIGWTNFNYSISDDVQVNLKSNFDYGKAAYFCISIKYKDITLIPYSYLVNYYHANMAHLIGYTRSYSMKRENWRTALNFVSDFVNKSKSDPEMFFRQYILAEVEEMIKGLRVTMSDPKKSFNLIKYNKNESINIKVIRDYNDSDKEEFDVMPKEFIIAFKGEKISSALEFIDSLEKLSVLCPELFDVTKEIREMNACIKPEVESVLTKVKVEIKQLKRERDELMKEIEKIEKKISFHCNQLNYYIENKTKQTKEDVRKWYKSIHPEYQNLKEQKKELELDKYELIEQYSKRKRLKKRIERCIETISCYA